MTVFKAICISDALNNVRETSKFVRALIIVSVFVYHAGYGTNAKLNI